MIMSMIMALFVPVVVIVVMIMIMVVPLIVVMAIIVAMLFAMIGGRFRFAFLFAAQKLAVTAAQYPLVAADAGGTGKIAIGGKAALSLALTLHELTTNAVKYGSLSVPQGEVAVTASLVGTEGEPRLRIAWTEHGGPPVARPSRKGFGSRLIERGLTAQVGAVLVLDYPPRGATCVVEAPLANFQAVD